MDSHRDRAAELRRDRHENNLSVERALRDFADRHPESRRRHFDARRVLPGGHTRTVLHHRPFPLTFVAAHGAVLVDADGHEYVDLLGDYTAGLLGHGDGRVLDAVHEAMSTLSSVGGVHPHEVALAELMCERFGIERVRFTNSGTEANLMAIATAQQATGRRTVLVFDGGYHGGVLSFAAGPSPTNVPHRFVVAPYNDLAATRASIAKHGDDLACIVVEPMLGSGGCIPATAEFLRGVVESAGEVGAVCIADEVMTSRHGRRGLADLLGVRPDLTTYGKYLGGGFSFGAFGGSVDLMDQFDTTRPSYLGHAGTFNNNVATMAAGRVVLGEAFTAGVAEVHTARGEEFRADVAAVLERHELPVSVSGFGSMMSLHARATAPVDATEAAQRDPALQELLFLGLYERGIYTAPRGMINLSLALTDDHLVKSLDALDATLTDISDAAR